MNLVSFALRRPVSVVVMVIAVVLAGLLAVKRMPRDIFPDLGVPILYVAQPYGGMDPAQMEGFPAPRKLSRPRSCATTRASKS